MRIISERFLRTCSPVSSRINLLKTPTSSRSSKTIRDSTSRLLKTPSTSRDKTTDITDAMIDTDKVSVWKCKICTHEIWKETRSKLQIAVIKHLRLVHREVAKQALYDNKKIGYKNISGLVLKEVHKPISFTRVAKRDWYQLCFTCPWCNKGVSKNTSQIVRWRSKLHRVNVCHKIPGSITMKQLYPKSRQVHSKFWAQQYPTHLGVKSLKLVHQKAVEKHHEPITIDFKKFWQKRVITFCEKCLARNSTSSYRRWRRNCNGIQQANNTTALTWRNLRKQGLIAKTFDIFQVDSERQAEVTKLIKEADKAGKYWHALEQEQANRSIQKRFKICPHEIEDILGV